MSLPEWTAGISSALDDKMGIELLELGPQRSRARMPVAGNTPPFGLWHGGASCVLAETLASLSAFAEVGSGGRVFGVDINATHHRSVRSGIVTGVATALHLGRQMASYEVVISDDRGKRVCTARITCALLPTESLVKPG